jgi:1,4-dihydroxy-2-naphthoate octaprenyltransferase
MASSIAPQDPRRSTSNRSTLRDLVVHLRLHFQLLLAPIFLWGFFLADGVLTRDFWLAFLAFHLFLYGGTTAYNSYYDRDEGPVGGLERPPPVNEWLLPFSLLMQAIGALLAALVNVPVLLVYLAIFVLATAYSFPGVRLKGRPLTGLLTVALGQGVLAALGGWLTAQPNLASVDVEGWIGIIAVTLITTGFYPITQIYQVEEDLARGDLTFAAWAGPQRTFAFAIVLQGIAVPLLLWTLWQTVGPLQALLVGLFYTALLASIIQWARHYNPADVIPNFRRVMRTYQITSLGFLAFLLLHLVIRSGLSI